MYTDFKEMIWKEEYWERRLWREALYSYEREPRRIFTSSIRLNERCLHEGGSLGNVDEIKLDTVISEIKNVVYKIRIDSQSAAWAFTVSTIQVQIN